MYIYPWNEKSNNYFERIQKNRCITIEDPNFSRNLKIKFPDIKKFIGNGRNPKTLETTIGLREGVVLEPIQTKKGIKNYKKYKIWKK
jgi:hypothetical protein